MSNKSKWGYDETKTMLNKIRSLNESKASSNLIMEDESQDPTLDDQSTQNKDFTVINDVEVKVHSSDTADLEITEEEKTAISSLIDNFRQQVDEMTEFTEGFNITSEQVRLDGKITDKDISFVFITGNDETGVYVNADMLKLDQEVITTIEKLEKFYHSFTDSMNELILNRKHN
jgi:hypothetical protein